MNTALLADPAPHEVKRRPAAGPEPAAWLAGLGRQGLLAVLDAMDTGVIVSDASGRLLMANDSASRELADGRLIRVADDGVLDVTGGAGLLALRRAVHGASRDLSHQLVLLRHADQRLLLSVQPLHTADMPQPCALLLMGRRTLAPELAVRHLARLHELTGAEQGVLAGLLAGERIDAMARARGVALSTVRTQVASLRTKFGVRRVDDLIRLVAELPPMRGVLRQGTPVRDAGAAARGGLQR